MNKSPCTIYKDVSIGIWDNCQYIARIYKDKIIIISPCVKWAGNTGNEYNDFFKIVIPHLPKGAKERLSDNPAVYDCHHE